MRYFKRNMLGLTALFFLVTCNNNPRSIIYYNDCDGNNGWRNETTITSKVSHSGKHSSMIDSNQKFSLSFNKQFKNISNKVNFESINISCYIYLTKIPSNAALVCDILSEQNGKVEHVKYQSYAFNEIKEKNKWVHIKKNFVLPEKLKPDYRLIVYVLKNTKEILYVDDLEVTLN